MATSSRPVKNLQGSLLLRKSLPTIPSLLLRKIPSQSSSVSEDKSSSSESPKSSSSEAIKASVAVQKSKVSKAETIQKKIYGCADGDSTRTFKFFDGSYVYETLVNDQVMNWNAGRYDIQRSTLLMLPLYYGGGWASRTMFSYSVGTDNKITAYNGESMNCMVEEVGYEYENAEDFVGEWVATKDGIDWTFTLKADGTSKLEAVEDTKKVEYKAGTWEVYGYYMVIDFNKLLNPGSTTSENMTVDLGRIPG